MIVRLNKCRNCGILREQSLTGGCAVCGGSDFVEVMFCDEHHAETVDGLCPYCENEKAAQAATKLKTKTPQSAPTPVPVPPPQSATKLKPKPSQATPPKPTPVPAPTPTPVPAPNIKTEKSGMGCWGCLVWPIVIIIIIIILNYIF